MTMDAEQLTQAEHELISAVLAAMGIEGTPTLEQFKAALELIRATQQPERLH